MTEPIEDLERRLRRTLDQAAAQVTADPPDWQERQQSMGWRPPARLPSFGALATLAFVAASVAVIAVAVLLAGRARPVPSAPPRPTTAGQPTPKFAPESALVRRVRHLRGTPIVIFAWASWCHPCQPDLPRIALAATRYRNRVRFLIADANDSRSAARAILKQHQASYPVYETKIRLHGILARPLEGLPTMIFINRQGKVSYVHALQYRSLASLERAVKTHLLNDRP
jgi:thiol-disulfide isomerase/thioredoxin